MKCCNEEMIKKAENMCFEYYYCSICKKPKLVKKPMWGSRRTDIFDHERRRFQNARR